MEAWDYIPEDWAEPVLSKWKARLARAGFEGAEIAYDMGFCQGSGASFTCDEPRVLPKLPRPVKLALTQALKLDRIEWYLVKGEKLKYPQAPDTLWGGSFSVYRPPGCRYVHQNSTNLEFYGDRFTGLSQRELPRSEAILAEHEQLVEKRLKDWMRSVNHCIYRQLERLYWQEYEHAEEFLKEQQKEELCEN